MTTKPTTKKTKDKTKTRQIINQQTKKHKQKTLNNNK